MRPDARAVLLALAALAGACAVAQAGQDLVIRAGRAFDGERWVESSVTLVASGGRLVAGPAPAGAAVLEAPALTVLPGFVDLRSAAGLAPWDANEEAAEVAPSWRALDAVDAHDLGFARALEGGVTTVVACPNGRGVIGGLAAAVKTDDRPLRARVVDEEVALVFSLGNEAAWGNRSAWFQQPYGTHFRRPGNRMGVASEVRRSLMAAEDGARGAGPAALRRVLDGSLPAWMLARTDQDLRTALRLGSEFGFRPVVLEASEAHRLAPDLSRGARAAVLGPAYQHPRNLVEYVEGQDMRAATPAILAQAGLPVAIATGPADDPGSLLDRAALAVRDGMPREAALAAITSVPASLLGLPGRLGTLKPGADADLVLVEGDPLSPAARVVGVVVDGRLAHRASSCPEPRPVPESPR